MGLEDNNQSNEKRLYIRFFHDKYNQIPTDSHPVETMVELTWELEEWLKKYPDGKVDFVNL